MGKYLRPVSWETVSEMKIACQRLKKQSTREHPIEGSRDWVREELNCDGVEKEDSLNPTRSFEAGVALRSGGHAFVPPPTLASTNHFLWAAPRLRM